MELHAARKSAGLWLRDRVPIVKKGGVIFFKRYHVLPSVYINRAISIDIVESFFDCEVCVMGRFVNPGNEAFRVVLNSEIYIDKTGLIEYTNKVMNTTQAFICNSRPRRFGKSITADMLTAYYSRACDSEKLFEGLEISRKNDFKKHLNKYDVIHLDVQWCMMDAGSPETTVAYMNEHLISELQEIYPDIVLDNDEKVYGALSRINAATGKKFVVIIDEWDVLIRDEALNQKVQDEYIGFLRGLFKGSEPTKYIQLAYLTGILPIKKIRTQSALNNFSEFTMLDASVLAPYIGFTEAEVRKLCAKYNEDYAKVKQWYDGYMLEEYQIYNPKAVVSLMLRGKYKSYWSDTGTYEVVVPLINMDFDGLKTAIIEIISGTAVEVDVSSFQNDTISFANRDDVLTYLIHLGYLGYDEKNQSAFIPNEEIRQELMKAVKRKKWNEWMSFQQESDTLLEATLNLESDQVAKQIEKIHTEYVSMIQYNDENSLSSVLTIGYLSAMKYYFKPIRELPSGRGFADFVFIPKPEYTGDYPALVVELKWNKDARTAIQQIKEKKYPDTVRQYTGKMLLVGINYDKKTKEHSCIIEKVDGE